jgi:hypothetical protein
MDSTGLTFEELMAAHKKRMEDSQREFDEFVEKLELKRQQKQKEIDEKYKKYSKFTDEE